MINIETLIAVAKEAGKEILKIYSTDFKIENKESETFDEGISPLTKADIASHNIITNSLKKLYPDIPLLSEESKEAPYEERKEWKVFFLIDPLDGTKEFIKRNGEFTVNIAFIENEKPTIGVVYLPVKDICYFCDGKNSYKQEADSDPLKISGRELGNKLIVVASRSHFTDETKKYIEKLGKPYDLLSAGSSLKLCLVAEGKADIYPRLGPTMEWDTAAAHAVVKGAGKKVINYETGNELTYNKENLLNPWFVVK